MEAILLVIMCIGCIGSFLIGAKVGQTVSKGKDIEISIPSPLNSHRTKEEQAQVKLEQDRLNAILSNIEAYDGTSQGQRNIP